MQARPRRSSNTAAHMAAHMPCILPPIRARAGGEATRTSWILTDNRSSESGWRVVGYEARGPVGGPLVVATVRSRDGDRERALEDARALVTLNAGE